MTAQTAVADGRLTNNELGAFVRRVDDLKRRLDDRTISFHSAMSELQRIAEGNEKAPGMRMTLRPHYRLQIGGMSPEQLLHLVEGECEVDTFAKERLTCSEFTTQTESTTADLVILTPAVFGTYRSRHLLNPEWLARWSECHLSGQVIDICPAEVGPRLCIAMKKQFTPVWWFTELIIAMKGLPDKTGWRGMFTARCGWEEERGSFSKLSGGDREWAPCHFLVYQVRQLHQDG